VVSIRLDPSNLDTIASGLGDGDPSDGDVFRSEDHGRTGVHYRHYRYRSPQPLCRSLDLLV
jgi:hypothetical protein